MVFGCNQTPGVKSKSAFLLSSVVATVFISLLFRGTARAETNLVWHDEFNGTSLDTTKWTYDTGNGFFAGSYWVSGWGNNELEYYTGRTNNVYVAGGFLHLHAQRESYGGQDYTSGRIKTTGLFSRKYGRFEFRAKLPTGTGFWPAFWMLPQNSPYGGWPNSGEIDVMENNGAHPERVGGTIHFGGANGNDVYFGQSYYFPGGNSAANFHIYTLEWTTNSIKWLVDEQLYETQNNWWSNIGRSSDTYPFPAPFDQSFYILMNLAIGGNYLGNPSTDLINTSLPGEVLVDYVRVYDDTPPLAISCELQPDGSLVLSWPAEIVCHLQELTVPSGLASGTGWVDVSNASYPYVVSRDTNAESVFYRLVSP